MQRTQVPELSASSKETSTFPMKYVIIGFISGFPFLFTKPKTIHVIVPLMKRKFDSLENKGAFH